MTATMVGIILLALIVHPATCMQDTSTSSTSSKANPIRKVVTMLQNMQKKVAAEGEKEKALYDKFMCYCKNGKGDLEASVAAATVKGPQLASDIEAGEAKKAQLTEDLFQHKADRDAAKAAIAEATAIRAKEAAEFAKEKGELDSNLAALAKAISALESGMSGAFLQTSEAQVVLKAVKSLSSIIEGDREEIIAFLSGTNSYAPASGEITGILKEIKDEMSASLAEATKTETAAIASFEAMVAAKKKEIAALTEAVEKKSVRIGELGVEIATLKNDMSDTEEALVKDKEFLAKLSTDCATKTAEWDEIEATRAMELVALADTIKILNDDDALELFKKALPSASASSLVQLKFTSASQKANALALLSKLQKRPQLDFIMLALRGRKIGFAKVIKMIDDMMATLKTEQLDDDHKKEYCAEQFDLTDDKLKALARSVADTETNIAALEETISSLSSELKALEDGIAALDELVAEATAQRKAENSDYVTLMADDSAAKELLSFAINRLNKFYNPKLYAATNFQQIAQRKGDAAPPPPPAAPGPYKTKSAESTGVIAMIQKIIKDLDKEMQEAKVMEADAQTDYEAVMKESAEKRAADSKSITEKESAKADAASSLDAATSAKAADSKMIMATESYKSSLHAECDWLLKYFDVRAAARTGEIDSLEKAKAVLSGADYSLVQVSNHKFLA
mmetsp:Transcript_76810/g.132908  ORF Transcript_76810/g.132908 Transcript_76810/m.132908 type:complete len:684 (+) Transcript_76810:67-2118(+)